MLLNLICSVSFCQLPAKNDEYWVKTISLFHRIHWLDNGLGSLIDDGTKLRHVNGVNNSMNDVFLLKQIGPATSVGWDTFGHQHGHNINKYPLPSIATSTNIQLPPKTPLQHKPPSRNKEAMKIAEQKRRMNIKVRLCMWERFKMRTHEQTHTCTHTHPYIYIISMWSIIPQYTEYRAYSLGDLQSLYFS